jgi:hypothetical protein
MSRFITSAAAGIVLTLAAMLSGCNSKSEPVSDQDAAPSGSTVLEESPSEIELTLAKLPPADRESAEIQKVCPISGEPLGSMGVPIKITEAGQSVFLCCKGCEEEAKKNFDAIVAKLESQSAPSAE